ncbi:MAG: hypothetical protein FWD36_09015 [Treponema sp.]|nr:hypothetical protein [Treponema sp.]
MNRNEFIEKYSNFVKYALDRSAKTRREGLLALENELDGEKINERDIFEYGMYFGVDGCDREIIYRILSNIIAQEKDEYTHLLKTIQLESVLSILAGDNPRILFYKLNSLTDLSLKDDPLAPQALHD